MVIAPLAFATSLLAELSDTLLMLGWFFLLFFALWIAWELYLLVKRIDYTASMQWTFYQVALPEDAAQTPKAMENAIEVWGGIHKDPDLVEKYFEGYMLPWYSLELACRQGEAKYVLVVPTGHAKFFEGVIYGQYPTASVVEAPDYTQEFPIQEMEKSFDLWGSEMELARDDIYPIRLYNEFADALAEDDRFVDPHQAIVEAFTNINPDEHFWIQILVKPMAAGTIQAWSDRGQERISELSGKKKEKEAGILGQVASFFGSLPGELWRAATIGPSESEAAEEKRERFVYNPSEDAEMKGIMQKVTRNGYRVKIRVIHLAPVGKVHKPNYGKAIGVFKQFNTFHLNSIKPSKSSKTNGPNFILKQTRRRFRKRVILLNFQWRDFFGDKSGQMMSAEEIATLYHFPAQYVRVPSVQRAASGLGSPPANLPYA